MRTAIQTIYKNRQSFIVIGLTGKIGAGCTTAADFLSSDQKEHSSLPEIQLKCDSTDNDRKDYIVQNYYFHNWKKFTKITVSDVMTHMLFNSDFNQVYELLRETYIEFIISSKLELYYINLPNHQQKLLKKHSLEILEFFKISYFKYKKDPKTTKFENLITDHITKIYNSFSKSIIDEVRNSKLPIKNKHRPSDQIHKEWRKIRKLLERKSVNDYIDTKLLKKVHQKHHVKVNKTNTVPNNILDKKSISTKESLKKTFDYITKYLPQASKEFKDALVSKRSEYRVYTLVYQKLGDNLRKYGSPAPKKENQKPSPKHIYCLSKLINNFIKIIRRQNTRQNKETFIVVDSFRNSIEALFFKERYSGFYLIAVNSSDENIKYRLKNLKQMTDYDISKQSSKEEDVESLKSINYFTSQNIRDCIQKSDVHISNNGDCSTDKSFISLYRQLIKFISLIQHPGLITPSLDEKMMQIAYTAKLNSGCLSRQVGAAVTNQSGSLVSIGWNSVAEGQTPCLLRNKVELLQFVGKKPDVTEIESLKAYSNYEKTEEFSHALLKYNPPIKFNENKTKSVYEHKKSHDGLNQSFCFKQVYNKHENDNNQVHTRSLHAEENAFLQISKHGGEGIIGGTLYSTASPCELCAKKAYQLGIAEIVYIDPYPGIAKSQILQAGLNIPTTILFSGAIGSAYHKMYEQILPYKDELDAYSSDSCCG